MNALATGTEDEVSARAERRRFTAEYKRKVLDAVDACTKPGEIAAVLRKEGLYSSHLASWRRQRREGGLAALTPKRRGPKAQPVDARDRRIVELERQNARLSARVEHAEAIIEVQKQVSQLLGIELPDPPAPNGSHSRPHVSNDNPFSEAQFKTLKYRPGFPARFGSLQDARSFCVDFFRWYNHEHHHGGLGLLTPHVVHYGLAVEQRQRRIEVLAAAQIAHPERFLCGVPMPPPLPTAVWINKPSVPQAEAIP